MPFSLARRVLAACALTIVFGSALFSESHPRPRTRKGGDADLYHGVRVADPYRWLEDDNSPETARWVEEQNKTTFAFLDKIPYRRAVKSRLEQLFDYPKYGPPLRRGEYFFYTRNEGLQNQPVFYRQKGLDGTPELVLDPNTLSPDGTAKLALFEVSKDGKYAAYGISAGGSDWLEMHVLEVGGRRVLPETLKHLKVTGAAWAGEGFFYSRYPDPEPGRELSSKNENHAVYFHRVGKPQSDDELVYEDPGNPQRFHFLVTTHDERYAVLSIYDFGKGKNGNALFYRDLRSGDKKFHPIVAEVSDDTFELLDNHGSRFLIQTNRGAPNGRVELWDPATKAWTVVVPEKPEPLEGAAVAGGKLFTRYLKDVASRAYVHDLNGRVENEIELPGSGTVMGLSGNPDDRFVFYTYASFNYPPTIFRYEIATRRASVFRAPEIRGFNPDAYQTIQVFVTSKDGTRVPMFLVHRKGLKLDGTNPVLLYGYGGFNASLTPSFSPLRLALLEQGFVFASANLRGGSEYGEKWHEAGTKLNKQNVFDDFIAAAEWVIANRYTSSARLAINGASNGGLLVGAVMNQRPELFRAAVPQVGVMDMLRFHKFTIAWNWASDYGSSESPEEFRALRAYSPLHNIRDGVKYPATLITTADHDDRVVPAHSFKYAATLQELASTENPVLIRIDTKSGHGASNTAKQIEETADIYSFLFWALGVEPKY